MEKENIVHLNVAYRVFIGQEPSDDLTVRSRCIAIMNHFDGRKFKGDVSVERSVRIAMYALALEYLEKHDLPYAWAPIEDRIRELDGRWIGNCDVDKEMLESLIFREG